MAQLFAGTSGFAYPGWKPGFYPEKLPAKKFLEHYSRRLNAVEINYTFRRLAALSTLTAWVEATQPGFLFASGCLDVSVATVRCLCWLARPADLTPPSTSKGQQS